VEANAAIIEVLRFNPLFSSTDTNGWKIKARRMDMMKIISTSEIKYNTKNKTDTPAIHNNDVITLLKVNSFIYH
jgi:hypothetical protein